MTKTDVAKLYETILAIPGMNEKVKIEFRMPRKQVLLLTKVLERGLNEGNAEEAGTLISMLPDETLEELHSLPVELLQKAGLTEMNEKIKGFLK